MEGWRGKKRKKVIGLKTAAMVIHERCEFQETGGKALRLSGLFITSPLPFFFHFHTTQHNTHEGMCNHTLEYHHTSCQRREMDGAAVVSDLVHTMRLSDFLCGACLASLNPARGETRLPQTKPPLTRPSLSLPCCSEDCLLFPCVIGVISTNGWSPGRI